MNSHQSSMQNILNQAKQMGWSGTESSWDSEAEYNTQAQGCQQELGTIETPTTKTPFMGWWDLSHTALVGFVLGALSALVLGMILYSLVG
jgi:hypothetical protein